MSHIIVGSCDKAVPTQTQKMFQMLGADFVSIIIELIKRLFNKQKHL